MGNKKIHVLSILLAVLVIAGATVLGTGSGRIAKSADAVEFKSAQSFGDPAAAKGLALKANAFLMGYEYPFRWSTNAVFAENGPRFSTIHEKVDQYYLHDIYPTDEFMKHEARVYVDLGLNGKLYQYAFDLMRGEEPGASKTVEIKLSDYMENYPVAIMVDGQKENDHIFIYTGSSNGISGSERDSAGRINSWLAEHFAVPVPKDEVGTLRIFKNSENNITLGYTSEDGRYIEEHRTGLIAFGDIVGSSCIIDLYTGDLGTTLAPGAAVYEIPIRETRYGLDLDISGVREAARNEEGFASRFCELSADKSMLLAAADDGSTLKAFVTSISTGRTRSIELCRLSAGQDYRAYYKDDYMVVDVFRDAWYCVAPGAGGSFDVISFPQSSAFEQGADFAMLHEGAMCTDVSFDGEKLAAAGYYGTVTRRETQYGRYTYFDFKGLYASVYDKGGLKYHEAWENSLRSLGSFEFGRQMQDRNFVTADWTE